MAYETKVILTMLADRVARADSLEEAYNCITKAACVEGMKLPDYEEARKEFSKEKNQ